MRLTDKQIASYQDVYYATYGVRISKAIALEQGLALCRLVKVLSTTEMKKNENYYEQKSTTGKDR
jgi:hypothetical protein